MKSEFERWLGDVWLSDAEWDESKNTYSDSRIHCMWSAWQHQQTKVDELTKQRDSFIKAYEIEVDKSVELQKRVDDLEKSQNSLELKAEESECVSMCLDDRAVAKCDEDGTEYSLWGRVCQFKKSNNVTEDDLERIYWEFDSERSKSDERLSFKNALRGLLEQALNGGDE